jgi:hypothetical protein
MSVITAVPYERGARQAWNTLNAEAANGHFLFDRGFMEYHADRFADASLIFLRDGAPIALLPANRAGERLHSHQGLTFGGIVHGEALRAGEMLAVFDALLAHARAAGLRGITYKAMPAIYHRTPAEAALYALFRHGAHCVRRDVTATIDYRAPVRQSRRRRRAIRRSATSGLAIGWETAWADFWPVLAEVLKRRHNRDPVHSPAEITGLAARFAEQIRLFVARHAGEIVAGVVMFETPEVAHAQYVAASPRGQDLCALDAIFDHLIRHYATSKRCFDFGISTDDAGRTLNEGLADYKQEWGGGAVVQDTYELPF